MGTRGTPELRIEESETAARHMLLEWRGNLRFPDARLENTLTARMTLAVKIRELKPDRKSTRLNSSHLGISYAVFCLKKKKTKPNTRSSVRAHRRAYRPSSSRCLD